MTQMIITIPTYRVTETRRERRERERRRKRRIIIAWCQRLAVLAVLTALISIIFLRIDSHKSEVDTPAPIAYEEPVYVPAVAVTSEPIQTAVIETIEQEEVLDEEVQPEEISDAEILEEVNEIVAQISPYAPGVTYYYNLSYADKVCIAKVVYGEARGECLEGQVAVAAVILNRFYSNNAFFKKDSIYSVCTQPYQFASIDNVTDEMLAANPSCMEAVEKACLGWDPTRQLFADGACYFFDPEGVEGYQKEIRTDIEYLQIGNHRFHNEFNQEAVARYK